MKNIAVHTTYKETFREVKETYKLDKYSPQGNFVNISHVERNILERELEVKVQQIGIYDFINLSFPKIAGSGYFCFFQKVETKERHVFYSRVELERKLASMLNQTFYWNCYISYSTYFKRKREFHTVNKRIKLSDGEFSKACDLKTKKEFFVTTKGREAKPRRTQSNITYTYLLVQDLDYYKYGISNEEAVKRISKLIKEDKIICPNFFIYTGQGIQLVWSLEPFKNIKEYTRDKEWRSIQDELIGIFTSVGLNPDTVVKNPSAVTRTTETYNRRAKDVVRTFYVNSARLTLDDFTFHHQLFPQPDKKVKPLKRQKMAKIYDFPLKKAEEILEEVKREWKEHHHVNDKILGKMNWNIQTLNEARVDDIFTYVKILKERNQPLPENAKRNWLVMVAAFHKLVATDGDVVAAHRVAVELWNEFADTSDTSLEEIVRRGFDQAVKKYNDWVNDSWDKTTYVQGGLFYNTKRLLEILEITEDYEIQYKFKTIKIRNKAYEAARKRFEKFGVEEAKNHTWESYQERRNEKLAEDEEDKLWLLRKALEKHPNAKKKELANLLGITDRTLRNWLKKMEK